MLHISLSEKDPTEVKDPSLIDELIAAIADGNAEQRVRILERITDLFIAGSRSYSGEHIDLFDDVLQRLTVDIEVKARAKLANQMARINGAPPKLIRKLAFDDKIEVAGPVLTHSERLTDADLVENATSKSQNHLYAIAQRLKLSEVVTDVLVERGDDRVVHKVAGNGGARFSLAGYGKLTTRASRDRKLTLILGQRSDLPRQYFIKLLETASASVRAKLEAANPHAAGAIKHTVDEVATAMQREAREASQEFSDAARNVKRRHNADGITEANVHTPAHAQEFERTVVALAKFGRFPVDLVERALLDEGDDMILILAKAAGLSWTTVRELLSMYAAKRRLDLEGLTQACDRYKRLSQQTARNIVAVHEQRMKRRAKEVAQAERAAAKAASGKKSSRPVSSAVPA
jgi:uncharacterized protein (DUF2336 family)